MYPYINHGINGRIEDCRHILLSCIKDSRFRYYTLNKTGGMILALCNGKSSVSDVGRSLSDKFGLDSLYAFRIVRKFLKKLIKEEIILVSACKQNSAVPLSFGLSNFNDINFTTPFIRRITVHNMMSKDFSRLTAPLEVFIRLLPHSPTDKINEIIDKIVDAGALEICFSGKHVLDRKDIVDLVQYAKSKGLKVSLYVKYGNLLSNSTILRLREIDLDIAEFSLDGSSASMQGASVTEDDFQKTIENMKIAARYGLSVVMICVANQINIKYISSLLRLARDIGAKRLGIAFFKPDRNESTENLNNILQFNFWGRRYVEMKVRLMALFSPVKITVLVTCAAGTIRCCVDSEGYVAPCVKLPPAECSGFFGNIFKQDLKEIWNSPNFKQFINPRSYGRPCSLCPIPYLPFFRSLPRCRADCRRVTYLESNDIFAGNQNCMIGKMLRVISRLCGKY